MSTEREPIRDVAHLGHVELLTPRPDKSLWFFTALLGMECVHQEGQSAYLRAYGDYATTTLKLTEAPQAGVGHVAWRAISQKALERRVAAVEPTGLGLGWSNGDFGHGANYRFRDPDGHLMELYFEEEKYVAPPALKSTLGNMPMKHPLHGVGVRKTDHLALLCKEVAPNRAFMDEVLGCQLREQVRYENGTVEIGSWMSFNANHHEVAYVKDRANVNGRLHHFSLYAETREHVLRAADLYMEHGIPIEAGPSRHNNSQAFYIYAYEPGGNRVEIYNSGFFVYAPDFEPVIWTEETRGPGVYWGQPLPESFMNYGTPAIEGR